jgi:hypothetical protein
MATVAKKPYVVAEGVPVAEHEVGSGWMVFAGVAFLIGAFANFFWGLGALGEKEYLNEGGLLYSTLNTWGWVAVVWSIVLLVGAIMLLARMQVGPIVGIVLAAISCIFWLFALPVLPLYAVTAIVIDMLVIYGLATYGMARH